MSCELHQERLSAYLDGALPEKEAFVLQSHLGECKVCSDVAKDFGRVDTLVSALVDVNLKVDNDFGRNVMTRVRMTEPAKSGSFVIGKRLAIFVAVFLVYAVYVLSATDLNGKLAVKSDLLRNVMIFNLMLAGLALVFIFFSNEMVDLNNRFLKKFSDQYNKISLTDVWVSRLIGLSIFMALLTHRFTFNVIDNLVRNIF